MAHYKLELGPIGTLILLACMFAVFGTVAYFVIRKKKNKQKQLEQLRANGNINVTPPAYTSPQNPDG